MGKLKKGNKVFFPKISDRLKVRIKATPNFTATLLDMVTSKRICTNTKYQSPKCTCEEGDQSVDHILFDFKLLERDRVRLKAEVTRSENWPVSRDKLGIKFYKYFKEFTGNIKLDTVQSIIKTRQIRNQPVNRIGRQQKIVCIS